MKRNTSTIFLLLLVIFTLSACASTKIEPQPNILTQEEAETIALTHAGLTAADVTRLHTEYEIDDGVPYYEVQFFKNQQEYDYTIHAKTGNILTYDIDSD